MPEAATEPDELSAWERAITLERAGAPNEEVIHRRATILEAEAVSEEASEQRELEAPAAVARPDELESAATPKRAATLEKASPMPLFMTEAHAEEQSLSEAQQDRKQRVDCGQQCELTWDAIPELVIGWLKSSLLKHQLAGQGGTPRFKTLDHFPGLGHKKVAQLLEDFERFLDEQLSRSRRAPHAREEAQQVSVPLQSEAPAIPRPPPRRPGEAGQGKVECASILITGQLAEEAGAAEYPSRAANTSPRRIGEVRHGRAEIAPMSIHDQADETPRRILLVDTRGASSPSRRRILLADTRGAGDAPAAAAAASGARSGLSPGPSKELKQVTRWVVKDDSSVAGAHDLTLRARCVGARAPPEALSARAPRQLMGSKARRGPARPRSGSPERSPPRSSLIGPPPVVSSRADYQPSLDCTINRVLCVSRTLTQEGRLPSGPPPLPPVPPPNASGPRTELPSSSILPVLSAMRGATTTPRLIMTGEKVSTFERSVGILLPSGTADVRLPQLAEAQGVPEKLRRDLSRRCLLPNSAVLCQHELAG